MKDPVAWGKLHGQKDIGIVVSVAEHRRVEFDREDAHRARMQEKFRGDSVV